MNEEKMSLRKIPWKHKVALLMIIMICISLGLYNYLSLVDVIKYSSFLFLVICASYFDVKNRMIPDWIHVSLVFIGLINCDVTKSIIGLVVSPLPFLFMALISEGSIGGGDIKLIGSSGFVLGFWNTIVASMIGIVAVVSFYTLYSLSYNKAKERKFPFAPFYNMGCILIICFGSG